MDNQLLRDIFGACIEASRILDTDSEFRQTLARTRSHLAPDQIGRGGQLQEWLHDWDLDTGKWKTHRHVPHLYGLFPSSQINTWDKGQLKDARITSLLGKPVEVRYGSNSRKLELTKGDSIVIGAGLNF